MRRLARLGVLGILLAAPFAHADPAPTKVEAECAKQQFESGVTLMQEGRFAEAVQRLNTSLACARRPATAFNLAVAQRGTGDVLAALGTFAQVLAGELGPISTAERKEARALLTATEREVAILEVHLTRSVPGAEIRIDGAQIAIPEDELVVKVRANPGSRRIHFAAVDHEALDQQVLLARGERRSLSFDPRPKADRRDGTLRLETSDRHAMLSVQGHASGPSPLVQQLPPGSYRVTIRAGANERSSVITVPAGRSVRLVLESPKARSVFSSPWFWGSVGLAVVAAGVTTAVLATTTVEREPRQLEPWGIVEALRIAP